MLRRWFICIILSCILAACQPTAPQIPSATHEPGDTVVTLKLATPAFAANDLIPKDFTCDGANRSPELSWTDVPPNAKSFVLIVDDPDAPNGTFTHWILFDIPSGARQLDAGTSIGIAGTNGFGQANYQGPCPPIGRGTHHYFFTLYALDVSTLNLKSGVSRRQVEAAINNHVVGQAQLIGLYGH